MSEAAQDVELERGSVTARLLISLLEHWLSELMNFFAWLVPALLVWFLAMRGHVPLVTFLAVTVLLSVAYVALAPILRTFLDISRFLPDPDRHVKWYASALHFTLRPALLFGLCQLIFPASLGVAPMWWLVGSQLAVMAGLTLAVYRPSAPGKALTYGLVRQMERDEAARRAQGADLPIPPFDLSQTTNDLGSN